MLYLDVRAVTALLRSVGVEQALAEIAGYLESDYKRWPEFEKSPRAACHAPEGIIEVMPIADRRLYSFKYVNGHPGNTARGLPTVMAFGLLAETAMGMPLLISEMTLLTAMRTAAMSALAGKYLMKPGARKMAVIGCGAQSEFQILAFRAVAGIGEFVVYDKDARAIEKLRRNLPDAAITVAASAAEAVRGADIVTTLTAAQGKNAVLTPEMIEPGMHVNGVGGDSPGKTELHPDVLRKAHVVVQFAPQTRHEGDIQQMPPDFPVTEFWQVATGAVPARGDAGQVTVFDSVGFAIEDFSTLRWLYDKARAAGVSAKLDLIPELPDPKNLYGLLRG